MVKVRGFLKPLSQHVFPPLTFSHCFLASARPTQSPFSYSTSVPCPLAVILAIIST